MEGKPTAFTSNTWMRSDLSPMEQLRAAALRAYPDADDLAVVNITGGLIEVWDRLARAAGVTTREFASGIADALGLLPADTLEPDQAVLSRIPTALARQNLLLPLREENGQMVIASALPFQGAGINRARFACGKPLDLRVAPPAELDEAIHKAYVSEADRVSGKISTALDEQAAASDEENISATERLARTLLSKAIKMRASDLHLHPYLRGSTVRFRIDGVLQRIALMPDGVGERIVRFFKAQGDMDPTTDHIPQDGRMSLNTDGRQFDLRISVLPAKGGESLVIRFLEQGRVYSLSQTGLSTAALQSLRRMLSNASGIILMTGPTGSGKSSTLYSMVSEINRPGVNIITIENPVEYQVPGLTQVEVNEKAGLTFANVIRSCMRQDPDIMLVGEIRDEETAETALQAAITGHLVLSTLHTNDAVTSVARLIGLGITPAVLSDALVGVIAQRLVRQLCKECRQPIDKDSMTIQEALFKQISNITPSYRAQGCEACGNTGYSGRAPVVEIFEVTPEVEALIAEGNTHSKLLKQENQGANKSLAGSAARLIISGETTVYEAFRVIGRDFWTDLAIEYGSKPPPNLPALEEAEDTFNGILVISQDQAFIQAMEQESENRNLKSLFCQTGKEANQMLRENEEVFFVVVDLQDQPDEDNVAFIHNARIELAWSYLPALLLLPAEHPELEQKLRDDGAVSEMLTKPVRQFDVFERVKAYVIGDTT